MNIINNNEERNRKLSIIILSLTVVFIFADQNLLAPNLSLIANEFNFNKIEKDQKLGQDISVGFFCIGGLFSLIVGYLTDKMNRIILYSIIIGIGESFCFFTYFTTSYLGLYICRIGTGISIGGAVPIIFSLLADFYSRGIYLILYLILNQFN